MSDVLTHPEIVRAVQTCESVPDQWQGTLTEGRFFYLRYRHGWVSLAVGPTPQSVEGCMTRERRVMHFEGVAVVADNIGEKYDGMFTSEAARNEAFAELYAAIEAAEDD